MLHHQSWAIALSRYTVGCAIPTLPKPVGCHCLQGMQHDGSILPSSRHFLTWRSLRVNVGNGHAITRTTFLLETTSLASDLGASFLAIIRRSWMEWTFGVKFSSQAWEPKGKVSTCGGSYSGMTVVGNSSARQKSIRRPVIRCNNLQTLIHSL